MVQWSLTMVNWSLTQVATGGSVVAEETKYGLWFEWSDAPYEWLCDRAGVVFTFDKLHEAEAIRDLLDMGLMPIEVKPYDGTEPTRAYPWPN